MRKERNNIFYGVDWLLVILYFILVGFGWVNIYAASSTEEKRYIFDFSTRYGKQLLWIALSIPIIIITLFFNSKFYERFASMLYLVSLISLVGVLLIGKKINGATSWYSFGPATIQPSEFAKAFTALALAKLISDRQYSFKLIKNQVKAFIIIFSPAFLIALQPDMGSVIIYLAFFFVLHREGLTLNYILLGVLATALFLLTIYFGPLPLFYSTFSIITIAALYLVYKGGKHFFRFNWHKLLAIYAVVGTFIFATGYVYNNVLQEHQKNRFDLLLGKVIDTQDIGYNSHQSVKTLSSGGWNGKGFLQGDRTQGKFVPEQDTDYIFSTVGEEWGFLGSSFLILLFMCLLYRIIYLAETQTNKFARIYGYGVASIIFFHVLVNIGMVIGILPTIGIPLPFISRGGSSLWGFTLLLFIFIRLDAHKSYDW